MGQKHNFWGIWRSSSAIFHLGPFPGDLWSISLGCPNWASMVMFPSSWTSPLQHKMLPHSRDPQVQHHPLTASYFGELGGGCGTVMGARHPGGLQGLLFSSSPESSSPWHSWSCLVACPGCHVDHWKKAKNLCYGALKANHFQYREWIIVSRIVSDLRILLDFINLKLIRILLAYWNNGFIHANIHAYIANTWCNWFVRMMCKGSGVLVISKLRWSEQCGLY